MIRPRGKQFQADFAVGGVRYRKSFPSEAQAVAWERETRELIARGGSITPQAAAEAVPRTLKELFDATYNRLWASSRNERAARINGQCVVDILGPDRPISSITTTVIDGLVTELRKKGNAGGTVNRKLSALSKMLNFARKRNWIIHVPHIDRAKESEHRLRWMTEDEETRLLAWCDFTGRTDLKDFIILLVDTGLRLSEGLRLTWKDVDGVWIRVWETKTDNPRSVPMTPRVELMLNARRQLHSENERVFEALDKWNTEYAWRQGRVYLGLEHDEQFVIHALRHTFCSRLVQRGVPINVVKELAGHKTITTTMRYAHLAPKQLLEAIRGVAQQPHLKAAGA